MGVRKTLKRSKLNSSKTKHLVCKLDIPKRRKTRRSRSSRRSENRRRTKNLRQLKNRKRSRNSKRFRQRGGKCGSLNPKPLSQQLGWASGTGDPLVGAAWTPCPAGNCGNHYKLGIPIGVGGQNPFWGMNSPSPQHGGKSKDNKGCPACGSDDARGAASVPSTNSTWPRPQQLVNLSRQGANWLGNLSNQWTGLRGNASVLPFRDHQTQPPPYY